MQDISQDTVRSNARKNASGTIQHRRADIGSVCYRGVHQFIQHAKLESEQSYPLTHLPRTSHADYDFDYYFDDLSKSGSYQASKSCTMLFKQV